MTVMAVLPMSNRPNRSEPDRLPGSLRVGNAGALGLPACSQLKVEKLS
jgi:hypothetical protein